MEVVVATVGRAHGVRGQVVLRVRTDRPDLRFATGSVFQVPDAAAGCPASVTLSSFRATPTGAVAAFEEVGDRDAADALRGQDLVAQVDPTEEAGAWYPSQLRGVRVELPDGTPVGTVADLLTGLAQDLLQIDQPDGTQALIPLVEQLVPVVDVSAGRIVVDPPAGLVAARPESGPEPRDR
jgi:16S rRNA processing protein RimM